jgi:hypothetical protein
MNHAAPVAGQPPAVRQMLAIGSRELGGVLMHAGVMGITRAGLC